MLRSREYLVEETLRHGDQLIQCILSIPRENRMQRKHTPSTGHVVF
jgi:hypothetical protein